MRSSVKSRQLMQAPASGIAFDTHWNSRETYYNKSASKQKLCSHRANILYGKQVRPSKFDGSSDAKIKNQLKAKTLIFVAYSKKVTAAQTRPDWSYISYFINWQLTFPIDLISLAWFLFCQLIIRLSISCVAVFNFHFVAWHAPQRNSSKYLLPAGFGAQRSVF